MVAIVGNDVMFCGKETIIGALCEGWYAKNIKQRQSRAAKERKGVEKKWMMSDDESLPHTYT